MPDGLNFVNDLARHIGQTVTIFTTSGGESGRGFTGVLISVNPSFVRLVTQLGSAPGCALGSCCDEKHHENHEREEYYWNNNRNRREGVEGAEFSGRNRFDCRGNTLGSIVDIPVNRIAAFVHNSVGSDGWY